MNNVKFHRYLPSGDVETVRIRIKQQSFRVRTSRAGRPTLRQVEDEMLRRGYTRHLLKGGTRRSAIASAVINALRSLR